MNISKPFKKETIQGTQTWATISELYPGDNRTFDVRVIPADKTTEEEDLLIAGDELMNYIHPGEWEDPNEGFRDRPEYGLSSEEMASISEEVYNAIFFFTDDTTLNYNDEKLIEDMKEENPDFFY